MKNIHCLQKKDGVFTFKIQSNALGAKQNLRYLENNDFHVTPEAVEAILGWAGSVVESRTHKIVVFKYNNDPAEDIQTRIEEYAKVSKKHLVAGDPKLACLIRKNLTDVDIIKMELQSIIVFCGEFSLSASVINRAGRDARKLDKVAKYGNKEERWWEYHGLAFIEGDLEST